MNKRSFTIILLCVTFTISTIFATNTMVSLKKENESLSKTVKEHEAKVKEHEAKLNQLYGGLNFLGMQVQALMNIEAMRTDPDFKEKMKQYNEGFKETKEGEENDEKDAFNRNLPKPPTDETK
jgi:peptidoglycan hydrolase CwlO-like protein